MRFEFQKQLNAMDCGPTCLAMISKYYGKFHKVEQLRQKAGFSKQGVNLLGLSQVAEDIGFRARGVQLSLHQLTEEVLSPCILHWGQNHFVVYLPSKKKKKNISYCTIADPANGIIKLSKKDFETNWIAQKETDGTGIGIALLLDPTAKFDNMDGDSGNKLSWRMLYVHLVKDRSKLFQIIISLVITSLFQLIFPFLTQSIIDVGINTQNLQYIVVILIAQLMLVFSRTIIEFIRSRLLLKMSVQINFSILSDFWTKLTRLPICYFDSFHTGDTLQRIGDGKKIETFLTGNAIFTFFSLFNFAIFGIVLAMYNSILFIIFLFGSILYFFWIRLFLNIRRKINYQSFHLYAKENTASIHLIQGMPELKLNNAEHIKRWEWENIQLKIFRFNFKNLSYAQIQQAGALFINEGKNVIMTFIVAQMVINGQLTLGAMLAIQYIIGQLNGPVEQFVNFIQTAQDAKISLERFNEIHQMSDEELPEVNTVNYLPEDKSISISDLSFSYPGAGNDPVLNNISLTIPDGKVTAIVGVSGSGKTTLLKLLLKFYNNYQGTIQIGSQESAENSTSIKYKYLNHSFWRSNCGAVLLDGYIFDDSVARNIGVGAEFPSYERLIYACNAANILAFIESLPNGFNTKIGPTGVGISQGQKQRILIARAIYKNPAYLFFDEATNALDANNEKVIISNLNQIFKGRTVVIVAHRLSTVRNADKIVVLHEGKIIEEGNHDDLARVKGMYYELVKNQLELGN